MISSRTNAPAKPMIGERIIGMTTLCETPDHSTPLDAGCTSAAPIRPPISACDELDGMPKHQVSRFQTIAPSSGEQRLLGHRGARR